MSTKLRLCSRDALPQISCLYLHIISYKHPGGGGGRGLLTRGDPLLPFLPVKVATHSEIVFHDHFCEF